jgi:arabinosaccharide transport system permease protein
MAETTAPELKPDSTLASAELAGNGASLLWRRRFEWAAVYAALLFFALLVGVPFIYMISGSFKTNSELFSYPINLLLTNPTMDNYSRLLSGNDIPYVQQFANSIFVSTSQTLLSLSISATVGWGFAKFEFRGKTILFILMLATLALPFQVTLVPLFQLIVQIGWLDNYLGVIVPGAISAFGAFFMRQSMLSIPDDLLDAARIDGSSEWGIFWRIGIPLSRGALSVLGVLVFLNAWSDYLWPVIVLRSPEKFTYPVGLATLVGLYKVEYGLILAGAFLATLPVLLIFVAGRKHILENLTVGAVKL